MKSILASLVAQSIEAFETMVRRLRNLEQASTRRQKLHVLRRSREVAHACLRKVTQAVCSGASKGRSQFQLFPCGRFERPRPSTTLPEVACKGHRFGEWAVVAYRASPNRAMAFATRGTRAPSGMITPFIQLCSRRCREVAA